MLTKNEDTRNNRLEEIRVALSKTGSDRVETNEARQIAIELGYQEQFEKRQKQRADMLKNLNDKYMSEIGEEGMTYSELLNLPKIRITH